MDPIEEAQNALEALRRDAQSTDNETQLQGIAGVIVALGEARRRAAVLDATTLRKEAIARGQRPPSDAAIVATMLDAELERCMANAEERRQRRMELTQGDRARKDAAAADSILSSDQ